MQMLEEVAKVDASTAWCLGQCSVCGMTAAYLDLDVAHQIFDAPDAVLAWGAVSHAVQAEPGGYRITARWDFASGSRQANWLGAHVQIIQADGTKRLRPNGAPEVHTIVFPATSATMYDVWDVIGLRGTGTNSYSVDNLFIPENFVAFRDDPSGLREKGPLYAFTTFAMFGLGFAAISVGVARATLDAMIELARGKASLGQKAMRENNAVLAGLGRMEGNLRAARAYIYANANEAWEEAREPASSRKIAAWRCVWPRPGPFIRPLPWSMPPITWPAPPPCSAPTSSNVGSATCTRSRSRSRPATPIMRMSAGCCWMPAPPSRAGRQTRAFSINGADAARDRLRRSSVRVATAKPRQIAMQRRMALSAAIKLARRAITS